MKTPAHLRALSKEVEEGVASSAEGANNGVEQGPVCVRLGGGGFRQSSFVIFILFGRVSSQFIKIISGFFFRKRIRIHFIHLTNKVLKKLNIKHQIKYFIDLKKC